MYKLIQTSQGQLATSYTVEITPDPDKTTMTDFERRVADQSAYGLAQWFIRKSQGTEANYARYNEMKKEEHKPQKQLGTCNW